MVVFNEIHYQPAGDNSALEFVELYNQLAVRVDLSNWRIDGDVRFNLPEGTVIEPGSYLVIARDPTALAAATGFNSALGPYDGFLSNSGNTLRLYNNNRAFRTTPQTNSNIPPDQLWSVDLQGDGNGGAFGQLAPPTLMSGAEVNTGLGATWNAFTISGHDGTTPNPSLPLVDSSGTASSVSFSVNGTVTGWSQTGSALIADYLFVNAGNSDPSVSWELSGLIPGKTYSMHPYGGVGRDIKITIDLDGDGLLTDETGVTAGGGGITITDIVASATGRVIGKAERGSVTEGNWGGFQFWEQTPTSNPPVGEATDSLEARRILDELNFSDTAPWPVGPDGSGFTLAKRSQITGTVQPNNWTVSATPNGTPGAPNVVAPSSQVSLNEVAGSDDLSFRVELVNHGNSPIPLGGMVLGSSNPLHADYTLPTQSLNPGSFLTLDASTLGFTPGDNNRLFLYGPGKTTLLDTVRVDNRAQARAQEGTGGWLRPDVATFGAPNSFSISDAIVINEIFYHAYPQRASQGVPPGTIDLQVLNFDSIWRYNLDAGPAGLPANWATVAHPVDGVSWDEGPGLLGLENTPLGEPIRTGITLSAKIPYYFETEFTYNDGEQVLDMVIDHYIDDGAIIFLNGVELDRFNMDDGPYLPTTVADPGVGNATLRRLVIPAPNLQQGSNRLSVEMHQVSTGSSDLVLGMQVTLRKSDGSRTPPTPYLERDEEWIELFNRSASPVDLAGWKLDGGIDFTFPDPTSIPSGGYLVVAKDGAALALKHPGATIVGDYANRLGNGGDLVILQDSVGNPVDEVRYHDSGDWHEKADGGGSSLELRDPDSDNAIGQAWAPSEETSRSNWQTHTYEGVAVNDGIGNNVYHEFILGLLDSGEFLLDDVSVVENGTTEFIQNGDFESDSTGGQPDKWRCLGTHGNHGRTLVVTDPDDAGNQCLHVVATGPTEDKHNKLETTFANGEQVVAGHTYRITFRAKWLSGSNLVNTRLYFNYLQRTTAMEVPEIWGTPGQANTNATANAGPMLRAMSHTPIVPDSGQQTTVKIAASDPDGLLDLFLFYSVEGGAFSASSMIANGDGTYRGTIPGQSTDRIIRFYVRARDNLGAESFYPSAGPNGGAYLKTRDNYQDTSGLRHNFRIIISDSDRTALFANTNRLSNDRIPATVVEDESIVYYNVGLRLKASAFGRFQSSHYGFNVKFQPNHRFRGVHDTVSIERSPNLKEIFAKHLMNRAGGGSWSFYEDVAHIITPISGDRGPGLLSMARHTERFFEGLYPDEDDSGTLFNLELLYNPNGTTGGPEGLKIGNPYNHTNGRYDLEDRGLDKEPYRWGFQIRSSRGRDDYTRLVALNRAMELSGSALKNALDDLIDVDQWMRTFAMASLNGTDDVYARIWEHNFRFYVRPTDEKILIFQWDLDRSFQLSTSASVIPSRNSVVKLFSIPQYRRLFDGHLHDLIHTTFNSQYASSWASHLSTITGDNLNGFPGYLSSRASTAQGSLPSSVSFAIATNGGSNFSVADSVVDLEGDGWVDVATIRVNGIPVDVTWLDGDTWRIAVPIAIGANNLIITAHNYRDTEVGEDRITVTNSSSIEIADETNIIISELNYHPTAPTVAELVAGYTDQDWFEFAELTNVGPVVVDLTQCKFTNGVTFTFPAGTILAPGAHLVVVSNQDAFEFRYGEGTANIAGTYSGNFRNSGERVVLEAADTTPIADFTYGDDIPWPEGADGLGYTLVLAGTDPAEPLDWRMSTLIDGSPGGSDAIPFGGSSGEEASYAIAAGPTGEISDSVFRISIDQFLAADDVVLTVEFSTDLKTWVPATQDDLISLTNQGTGIVTQVWQSPFAVSAGTRQFTRIRAALR